MVLSRSGNRPHLVLPCKSGRYKCDSECANFKSLAICSHVVAVAELNKSLQEFITQFIKLKKQPNFTQLALHDMPSGRGRKGARAPRKRKKTEPASTRIDRLSCASAMVTSTAPSYTVSVTQTHTSGSSVNVSTLPGPSYYNYASPCFTGYTFWPTPTSPYDWSYSYMPIPPPPPSSQLPPAPPMAEENHKEVLLALGICFHIQSTWKYFPQ